MARRLDWDRARRENLVAERGTTPADEGPPPEPVLSDEERQANRVARDELAQEFARLSGPDRERHQREFKSRLRKLCTNERAVQGAWSIHFEPLLLSGAPAARPADQGPQGSRRSASRTTTRQETKPIQARPDRRKAVPADPKATVAIMALVARYPGRLEQKTCAMVLGGSTRHDLRTAGLDRSELYGRLRGISVSAIKQQVELAVERGRVLLDSDGHLVPGRGIQASSAARGEAASPETSKKGKMRRTGTDSWPPAPTGARVQWPSLPTRPDPPDLSA